jgi:bifunctional DNA-binding transcriptional regulator/antitoxin component of YhaV-PrlF toxin-antitoxin module
MSMTVQLAQRGVLTLPKSLRDTHRFKAGDVFTITDLGEGVILLQRERSKVDDLLDEIGSELIESGESLDTMLIRLRAKRERQRLESLAA